MKRITLLCALLVMSTMSYAKIGRHNLQINIGGGYQSVYTPETTSFTYLPGSSIPVAATYPELSTGGGMFTVELGYLLHSVRQNNVVHGLDMRGHFTMGFLKGDYMSTQLDSQKMYVGGTMAYTLGRQLKSGRLMFDILGFGFQYGTTETVVSAPGETSQSTGSAVNLGIQYVAPGVQYIMNNGLTIGWRNKIDLNFGAQRHAGLVGFNTAVTIGYTFGGGKQPWEKKAS